MLFTGVFTPFTPNVIIAKIDENFGFSTYTISTYGSPYVYSTQSFWRLLILFRNIFSSNRSYLFHWFFFPTFFLCFGTSIVQILLVCLMFHTSMESFILSIFSFLFFRMDYFYWFIFSFLAISLLSFQIYFWANLVRGWEQLQTGRPQISMILSWRPAVLH